MAMFDEYEPDPPLACPECGKPLTCWQGKDGPCLLIRWKQGSRLPNWLPHGGDKPEEEAWGYQPGLLLPYRFRIYSYSCPDHPGIEAIGECEAGCWARTRLLGRPEARVKPPVAGPESPRERMMRIIAAQPVDASWRALVEALALDRMIERGLESAGTGRSISQDEMLREVDSWILDR